MELLETVLLVGVILLLLLLRAFLDDFTHGARMHAIKSHLQTIHDGTRLCRVSHRHAQPSCALDHSPVRADGNHQRGHE